MISFGHLFIVLICQFKIGTILSRRLFIGKLYEMQVI